MFTHVNAALAFVNALFTYVNAKNPKSLKSQTLTNVNEGIPTATPLGMTCHGSSAAQQRGGNLISLRKWPIGFHP